MATVKVTRAMAEAALAAHDWTASDALTDADIERQVAGNPDAAPLLYDEDFSKWTKVRGRPKLGSGPARAAHYRTDSAGRINVAALRGRLNMTQAEFAKAFGFTTASIRSMEQGTRNPSGAARTVLKLIDRDPDYVRETLKKA